MIHQRMAKLERQARAICPADNGDAQTQRLLDLLHGIMERLGVEPYEPPSRPPGLSDTDWLKWQMKDIAEGHRGNNQE